MYDKAQAQAVGVEGIKSVLAATDGVQTADVAIFMGLGAALMVATDEFQENRNAALADMISGAASHYADYRLEAGLNGYNKAAAQAIGAELINTGVAASDGVDIQDINALVSLGDAVVKAAASLKLDKDAAIFDVVAGAASAFADLQLAQVEEPAAAPSPNPDPADTFDPPGSQED